MEYVSNANGVWIPIGIFAMILIAGVIDLARTPKR